MGDLSDPSTAVVMDNAGAGVMSSTLIKNGVKSLYIFEPTSNLLLRPDNGFNKLKIIRVVNSSRDLVCLTRNYSSNSTPFQLKDVEFYLVMQESYGRVSFYIFI